MEAPFTRQGDLYCGATTDYLCVGESLTFGVGAFSLWVVVQQ